MFNWIINSYELREIFMNGEIYMELQSNRSYFEKIDKF
jgi:hypothetical protein